MFKTHAWGGKGEKPQGALDPDRFNTVARMHRSTRRVLLPSVGLHMERQGDRMIITGPGRLDSTLREAVSSGRAERIFEPPRCHACGRYVARRSTGRPRKYCDGRCRSRYRRRLV